MSKTNLQLNKKSNQLNVAINKPKIADTHTKINTICTLNSKISDISSHNNKISTSNDNMPNLNNHSNILSHRTDIQNNHSQRYQSYKDHDDNTKLYTFCENQNKTQTDIQNNQNKSTINLNNRQRKVSLNNKGKIFQPKTKSISKLETIPLISHDKKKRNNISMATINTINTTFDRRKTQKPTTSRNQNKKINISICLNSKTLRESDLMEATNEKDQSISEKKWLRYQSPFQNDLQDRDFNDKQRKRQIDTQQVNARNRSAKHAGNLQKNKTQIGKNYLQLREGNKCFVQEGKTKIIVEEQELIKFTKKFAQQKYNLQQKLQNYLRTITNYEEKCKQWSIEKKDMDDYIAYLQNQKAKLHQENQNLKNKIKIILSDNEYYIMAKDQSRKTIKEQQLQIQDLFNSLEQAKSQLVKYKQSFNASNQSSYYQKIELTKKLNLVQIQNCHIKNQLKINQNQIGRFSSAKLSKQQRQDYQNKIFMLQQCNKRLKQSLKQLRMAKMYTQIDRKTLQDYTIIIGHLQQQNIRLKKYGQNDVLKTSSNLSTFEFKFDSNSGKYQDSSPSEVQLIWKRERTEQNKQDNNQNTSIQAFDCSFLFKQSKQSA